MVRWAWLPFSTGRRGCISDRPFVFVYGYGTMDPTTKHTTPDCER